MTLQAEATDTAKEITLTVNGATGGITGLTVVLAIRDGATSYLDFSDNTFKTSGWTTRQAAVAEVSAALSPGTYRYNYNVAASGVAVGKTLVLEYAVSGAATAVQSESIEIMQTLYSPASSSQLNQSVEIVIEALSPTQTSLAKGTLLPNVYAGHKGDVITLPVYRNQTLMTDAELAGAINLSIQFKNIDTAVQFSISAGVAVGPNGTVTYTTVDGDGVFEAAGTWEYQATGETAAAGNPDFRSQVDQTVVLDPIPTVP